MKKAPLIAIAAFLSIFFCSCGSQNDSRLKGIWTTDSAMSPVSVITFDGSVCTFKEALFDNTLEFQYRTDSKKKTITYYAIGNTIEKAKQTGQEAYSVNGYTLRLGKGEIVFRKQR